MVWLPAPVRPACVDQASPTFSFCPMWRCPCCYSGGPRTWARVATSACLGVPPCINSHTLPPSTWHFHHPLHALCAALCCAVLSAQRCGSNPGVRTKIRCSRCEPRRRRAAARVRYTCCVLCCVPNVNSWGLCCVHALACPSRVPCLAFL